MEGYLLKRKKIGNADITGDKGIALIHRVVLDMGCIWTPTKLEAGIDGYIELRDPTSGDVSNCIIQVQSKAGASWFKSETAASFDFTCDERDLNYWLSGNAPVILVVSRPDDYEAYWVSIKDYFKEAATRKTRKITFDKRSDRFDKDSRERLAQLATVPNSGFYLSALPCTEVLASNLLPVTDYPKRLFRASTKLRFASQVWERLREQTDKPHVEWLLHDGFIYSFHDLTFAPWPAVCLASTTENLATNDWAFSDDRNRRYVFVRMLRNGLQEILYRQGVRYSKDKEHYFFRSTTELVERKVGGLSVFKAYESKTTPGRIAYYRHRAMKSQFLRHDRQWFVEITPSYHFTQDGFKLSRFFEERLKGIKQIERQNKTHLRQVRLWEEVLRQVHVQAPVAAESAARQLSMFEPEIAAEQPKPVEPYSLVSFGNLVEFSVEWAVPESAWLPSDTVQTDDEDDEQQRRLFE